MAFNRGFAFAVSVAAIAVAQLVGNAGAATYVVGDSLGWTVPPNVSAYSTWASQHVFRVGDVLVFNFSTGFHDVAHVNKAAFDGCSSNNPISLATVGPASLTVNSTGEQYYICTFAQHCPLGQKLAINVTGSSTSPAPAPAPTSPTIPPPPAQTPTTTPAPTPAPGAPTPPSPTPSPSPSPSASPSPAQTPSSMPSPSPPGGVTPSPGSESAPGDVIPPPPPSSATIAAISTPFVVFSAVAFGFMI